MAVNFAPIFNGWQGFTPSGLPLTGGLVQTYLAGTSTPAATYTTNVGNIANSNPIQLGADGRPPSEIWLTASSSYKFVLLDSLSNTIATYDNITGIAQTPSAIFVTVGATPTFISATQFTIPGNFLTTFQTGIRIQYTIAASNFYGSVTNATFATGVTTVTILADATPLSSGLNAVAVSQLTPDNGSVPVIIEQATTFQKLGTYTLGVNVGNADQAATNTLDWYEENTFTPTLNFGGASVGITYNINRAASYTRIGNRVFGEILMQLSSKGSSTGAAFIAGLPYAPLNSGAAEWSAYVYDYSSMATITTPMAYVTWISNQIGLSNSGATAVTPMTDANFTNSSRILVSFSYRVV